MGDACRDCWGWGKGGSTGRVRVYVLGLPHIRSPLAPHHFLFGQVHGGLLPLWLGRYASSPWLIVAFFDCIAAPLFVLEHSINIRWYRHGVHKALCSSRLSQRRTAWRLREDRYVPRTDSKRLFPRLKIVRPSSSWEDAYDCNIGRKSSQTDYLPGSKRPWYTWKHFCFQRAPPPVKHVRRNDDILAQASSSNNIARTRCTQCALPPV